jgi:hypothetical protein
MAPLVLRLSNPNDKTIRWKALMNRFLMIPSVFTSSKTNDMTIRWKALNIPDISTF